MHLEGEPLPPHLHPHPGLSRPQLQVHLALPSVKVRRSVAQQGKRPVLQHYPNKHNHSNSNRNLGSSSSSRAHQRAARSKEPLLRCILRLVVEASDRAGLRAVVLVVVGRRPDQREMRGRWARWGRERLMLVYARSRSRDEMCECECECDTITFLPVIFIFAWRKVERDAAYRTLFTSRSVSQNPPPVIHLCISVPVPLRWAHSPKESGRSPSPSLSLDRFLTHALYRSLGSTSPQSLRASLPVPQARPSWHRQASDAPRGAAALVLALPRSVVCAGRRQRRVESRKGEKRRRE